MSISNLERLIEARDEFNEKLITDGTALIREAFTSYFKTYPEVKFIAWTQCTPYFNDGDPCTFSVHEFSASTKDRDIDAEDDMDGMYGLEGSDKEYFYTGEDERDAPPLADLRRLNLVCSRLDVVMLDMFGDHSSIVATPSGFQVEEYCHD